MTDTIKNVYFIVINSRWKHYHGIAIYLIQRLYLCSIIATENSKALTFPKLIDRIVNVLVVNQTEVIAISTYNSSANITAFDKKDGEKETIH